MARKITWKTQTLGIALIVVCMVAVLMFSTYMWNQAHGQELVLKPEYQSQPLVVLDQPEPEPEPEPVVHNPACERWYGLSDRQRRVLNRAYHYGDPYNLGLTMAALALSESNAGQWRLNYKSNDFGVMQINITTASSILGVTNHFKRMELAERLVTDEELNFYLAHQVLDHFRGDRVQTNQSWREMVMSYNEGYSWRSSERSFQKATRYVESVAVHVNLLRECAPWG